MPSQKAVVTRDGSYKPSSPDMPELRYLIETEDYRWEAYVSRMIVRETGTTVYHAVVENEHSAYGLTANEAVNELAGIMLMKSGSYIRKNRTVSLSEVGSRLDPHDSAREYEKAFEGRIHGSTLKKLFGL